MTFSIYFQGRELRPDPAKRIVWANNRLILQRISRHNAGNYTCNAGNSEGSSQSNVVYLRVKCKSFPRNILASAHLYLVRVRCIIQASWWCTLFPPSYHQFSYINSWQIVGISCSRFFCGSMRTKEWGSERCGRGKYWKMDTTQSLFDAGKINWKSHVECQGALFPLFAFSILLNVKQTFMIYVYLLLCELLMTVLDMA